MKLKPVLIKTGAILLSVYAVFGVILFLSQKSMIYFPDKQDFEKCAGFSDYQ